MLAFSLQSWPFLDADDAAATAEASSSKPASSEAEQRDAIVDDGEVASANNRTMQLDVGAARFAPWTFVQVAALCVRYCPVLKNGHPPLHNTQHVSRPARRAQRVWCSPLCTTLRANADAELELVGKADSIAVQMPLNILTRSNHVVCCLSCSCPCSHWHCSSLHHGQGCTQGG